MKEDLVLFTKESLEAQKFVLKRYLTRMLTKIFLKNFRTKFIINLDIDAKQTKTSQYYFAYGCSV